MEALDSWILAAEAAAATYAADPSTVTLSRYVDAWDVALLGLTAAVDLETQSSVALRAAAAHLEAYRRVGGDDHADVAERIFDRLRRYAPDPEVALGATADLATVRFVRYQSDGRSARLRSAMSLYEEALRRCPDDYALRPVLLGGLGNALAELGRREGISNLVNRAVALHEDAVAGAAPDAPFGPMLEVNLATALITRFQAAGNVDDLNRAEQIHTQLSAVARDDELVVIARAEMWWERYALTRRTGILDEIVAELGAMIENIPEGDPQFATAAGNLANALLERQVRTAIPADVLGMLGAALTNLPAGAPERARLQHVSGSAYWQEYQRTGDLGQLDQAIAAWEKAVTLLGVNDVMRPGYLNSAAIGHLQRHAHRSSEADLVAAVRTARRAVRSTPVRSAIEPVVWNTLGHTLAARHRRRGRARDLREAVDAWQHALAVCPPSGFDRPSYVASLAGGLRERAAHERGDATSDLLAAIELYREAIAALDGSQELPGQLVNYGMTLQGLAARTADTARYLEASEVFRQAVDLGLRVSPGEALRAGLTWQAMAVDGVVDPVRAGAAGDGSTRALWILLAGQFVRANKEWWLRTCVGLAATTATAHAATGEAVSAVLALESGRAVLLEGVLPSERLHAGHPDLADRYAATAAALRALTPPDAGPGQPALRP